MRMWEWKKIGEHLIPGNVPICVGSKINIVGLGKKFLWYSAIINDEGILTDAEGEELGWDLVDFSHFCVLPNLPE